MMMPRVAAKSEASLYSRMAASRASAHSCAPVLPVPLSASFSVASQLAAACSKETFSSWSPTSALVAGVKIGSGSFCASLRPAGRAMPQIAPVA